MKRLVHIVLAAIVLLCAAAVVLFWSGIGSRDVYTQIDNDHCVAITPDAGMTHEYTLTACDENGQEESITFRTERVLRDSAYLKLTVAPPAWRRQLGRSSAFRHAAAGSRPLPRIKHSRTGNDAHCFAFARRWAFLMKVLYTRWCFKGVFVIK